MPIAFLPQACLVGKTDSSLHCKLEAETLTLSAAFHHRNRYDSSGFRVIEQIGRLQTLRPENNRFRRVVPCQSMLA